MSVNRIIYLILAILGFILPWYCNLQFFSHGGLGFMDFIQQSSPNFAAKSLTFDLCIAAFAGSIWMYFESKRVGIKFVWIYLLLAVTVAFAFAFPLFLFMRETELEKQRELQG